jgi:preprotein translocase subunit SecB
MSPETESKAPPTFSLVNIVITKAVYELIGDQEVNIGVRPAKIDVKLELIAGVKLFNVQTADGADHQGALVELDSKIIPNLEWQPYRLEVKIAGMFQTQNGTIEDLKTFCQKAAPSILFPYIRETAHRLTMDAPAGPIRLDPMNIASLLNQKPWSDANVNASATEPQQPSSQSASALPDSEPQP